MLAYAIRHAQSEFNARHSTSLNAQLTQLGRRQTEALVKRLASVEASVIYCSPFVRCLETAIPLARSIGCRIWIHPQLSEFHQGVDGQDSEVEDLEQVLARVPEADACPDAPQPFVWAPVTESLPQVIDRMQQFAAYLKDRWRNPDDTVVIVSHGSPIARLIESWLTDQPGPAFRFVIDNCTLSSLRFDGGISTLVCLNEASHLRGLQAPESANFDDDGLIKTVGSYGF